MFPRGACNLLSGSNSEIDSHLVSTFITWVPKVSAEPTFYSFTYLHLPILISDLNHAQSHALSSANFTPGGRQFYNRFSASPKPRNQHGGFAWFGRCR
jgi:hypothetical protein